MADNSEQNWQTVSTSIKNAASAYVIHERPYKQKQTQRSGELRKVANTDTGKPKMLTLESRSAMGAARVTFSLTQKELDIRGSFPANSCSAWESGRICPTSIQIQTLHRILGVKLVRA